MHGCAASTARWLSEGPQPRLLGGLVADPLGGDGQRDQQQEGHRQPSDDADEDAAEDLEDERIRVGWLGHEHARDATDDEADRSAAGEVGEQVPDEVGLAEVRPLLVDGGEDDHGCRDDAEASADHDGHEQAGVGGLRAVVRPVGDVPAGHRRDADESHGGHAHATNGLDGEH